MARVAILPVPTDGGISYHAVAGDKHAQGKTPGEALDALTVQFSQSELGTLVIVQNLHPDAFFSATQQQRLAELMERWRRVLDVGQNLLPAEQLELDALVEAELRASAARAAALAGELGR